VSKRARNHLIRAFDAVAANELIEEHAWGHRVGPFVHCYH